VGGEKDHNSLHRKFIVGGGAMNGKAGGREKGIKRITDQDRDFRGSKASWESGKRIRASMAILYRPRGRGLKN